MNRIDTMADRDVECQSQNLKKNDGKKFVASLSETEIQ